jgi:iron complex transport system permease protein
MRLSSRGTAAFAVLLVLGWFVLSILSVRAGWKGALAWDELARGVLATLGLAEPLEGTQQDIVRLRLWRTLTAGAVGASLALAGAYLQGLFRNGLASPAVVGVTAGSVLGASLAIALIGGYGAGLVALRPSLVGPALVTGFALLGAVGVTWTVVSLASTGRRLSIPTLLLAGIAMNTLIGGILAALQSLTLQDFEVSRAILAWTFGTLDDRSGGQVFLALLGLGLAVAAIPFVALELDLFAGGEEDAEALGVNVQRVKVVTLLAATLSTAAAVSVAGQIPFVGLVVPHVVRSLVGARHRAVLPLSMLVGAVFLLGCDLAQRTALADSGLRPGVLMSLVGGPFFLFLLVKNRRAFGSW